MKQEEVNTEFVIGIDGGGTSTKGILATADGKILAKAEVEATNFLIIGTELAAQRVVGLILKCLKNGKVNSGKIKKVVIGLAGAGRKNDQQRFYDEILLAAKKENLQIENLIVTSDAEIALEGAFNGKSGIILIAGTGSIVLGKDLNGKILRAGGWGRLIGDEGSGYYIGKLAINVISKLIDRQKKNTKFLKYFGNKFGLTSQEKIIDKVYRENFALNLLAPGVIKLAQKKGSPEANKIVRSSIIELKLLIETLIEKGVFRKLVSLSKVEYISIVCFGGLIEGSPYFRKKLFEKLEKCELDLKVLKQKKSALDGALMLALKK